MEKSTGTRSLLNDFQRNKRLDFILKDVLLCLFHIHTLFTCVVFNDSLQHCNNILTQTDVFACMSIQFVSIRIPKQFCFYKVCNILQLYVNSQTEISLCFTKCLKVIHFKLSKIVQIYLIVYMYSCVLRVPFCLVIL